jgi:oligoendopeptidase F
MYNEWSLDIFYKGADDPKLASDIARLEAAIKEYSDAVAALDANDARATLRRAIEIEEEVTVLFSRIAGYFSLRRSANSGDTEGARYLTKIQALGASTTGPSVAFEKFVGSLDNLDEIIADDELLSHYTFYFNVLFK